MRQLSSVGYIYSIVTSYKAPEKQPCLTGHPVPEHEDYVYLVELFDKDHIFDRCFVFVEGILKLTLEKKGCTNLNIIQGDKHGRVILVPS